MGIGPYDAIHVGAAAPTLPTALVEQLARPGRMFVPVGTFMQYIEQVDKDGEGNVTAQKVMGVRVRSIQDSESLILPMFDNRFRSMFH